MISLTPSDIIEHMFCPRFTYFQFVLRIPQYEERHFKVLKGRQVHEEKAIRNKEYLRKRIGVKEKYLQQYLTNDFLRGEIDEVLLLEDGTMAPLDYKYAVYKGKVYNVSKIQLACYALLIEDNYKRPVHKGYLVYVRSRNQLVEVPIGDKEKKRVLRAAEEINRIIGQNIYPPATKFKKKCLTCTYRNICTR